MMAMMRNREQASQAGGGERTGLVGGRSNLELKKGPPVDLELVLLLLAKQSGLLRQLLHSSAGSLLLLRGGHDDDGCCCWVCLFVVSKMLLFHYVVLYSGGVLVMPNSRGELEEARPTHGRKRGSSKPGQHPGGSPPRIQVKCPCPAKTSNLHSQVGCRVSSGWSPHVRACNTTKLACVHIKTSMRAGSPHSRRRSDSRPRALQDS